MYDRLKGMSLCLSMVAACATFASEEVRADQPTVVYPDSMTKLTFIESSYPYWSPDGTRLVFQSNRNGNSDIYTMNLDGSGLSRLTDAAAEDYTPVWSPDGTRIVFQSDRDGNREIYIMNADGSNEINLTNHPAEDSHPKFSNDGARIIFDSDRDTQPGSKRSNYEIYEMNVDGSDVRRRTDYANWDTYSSISPDGMRILWRRVTPERSEGAGPNNSEIFVMNRDGSSPVNLTHHPAFDGWPSWSPDGARVAFASDRDSPHRWAIYVMDVDGSNVTRLTQEDPGGGYFSKPIWSPDGSRIVCTRSRGDDVEIFLVHLGSGPRSDDTTTSLRFTRLTSGDLVNDGGQSRGLAWGDYDGDGDWDLYVANTGGQWNFLYRNDTPSTFQIGSLARFTKMRGVEVVRHGGFSEGVNWVDYDGDDDADLFVANTDDEPNFLFRNDGSGSFVRIEGEPLVTDVQSSSAACWADYNNDGRLDVFVVNRGGQDDALYVGIANGGFARVRESPVIRNGGEGRACAWCDVDSDGDLDLYVGNYRERNFFYRNDGNGSFIEETTGEFVEVSSTRSSNTYGVSFADFDNDGDPDLFVTNVSPTGNELFRNDGQGRFERILHGPGAVDAGRASKGHTWGDFDNDGDLDLFVANGTYSTDMRNFLYVNDGTGVFARVLTGPVATDADTSAGTAWADFDRDGDLDLFVANWGSDDQSNALYRNDTPPAGWLSVRLVGIQSNRSGIGARLRLKATIQGRPIWQSRWMFVETGYASQNAPDCHFGLGQASVVDSLMILWPSGVTDVYTTIEPNRFLIAVEQEELKLDPHQAP